MSGGVLYLTYDGVLDPLGQSQVLPYIRRLARRRPFVLLSFEKADRFADRERVRRLSEELAVVGIRWRPFRYHKSPTIPATCLDIAVGAFAAMCLALRYRCVVLHARSLIPALMALPSKWILGRSLLFDIRGFWVDCRREQGHWTESSLVYRVLKFLERLAYRNADAVSTLTRRAARMVRRFDCLRHPPPLVATIPTCVDAEQFRPKPSLDSRGGTFVLGYVGSVGRLYMFREVLECFKVLLSIRPEARLLVVNNSDHVEVLAAVAEQEVPPERVELVASDHSGVPELMRRMDVAVSFVLATPSMAAAAPTKIGEYLASGLPVIANTQPGDLEEQFSDRAIGMGLVEFTPEKYLEALQHVMGLTLNPATRGACVRAAGRFYSLERGVACYEALYRRLAGNCAVRPGKKPLEI